MKRHLEFCFFIVLNLTLAISVVQAENPNIWINEFHYDNEGSDVGEFVEIVAPADFRHTDLVTISFYNGGNGTIYDSQTLNNFTLGSQNGEFAFYYLDYSGIQNGAPDGFSVDYDGTLLHFLSYEGEFVATEGPANGLVSIDVGIQEETNTSVGLSLQLIGMGNKPEDFRWIGPAAESKGYPNEDQSLPVNLTFFSASLVRQGVLLTWITETETNNLGFILERRQGNDNWMTRASYTSHPELVGHGTTTIAQEYSFLDNRIEWGEKYEYRIADIDVNGSRGVFSTLKILTRHKEMDAAVFPETLTLQNYPNPFNPITEFKFFVSKGGKVTLKIFDLSGKLKALLVDEIKSAGTHTVKWDASGLAAGQYFYEIKTEFGRKIKKCCLIK